MKLIILQHPISIHHTSSMFFNGVVATCKVGEETYQLKTAGEAKLFYKGKYYQDSEIIQLGLSDIIKDEDLELEKKLIVFVDNYFMITNNDRRINFDFEFDYYDEAIKGFEKYCKNL